MEHRLDASPSVVAKNAVVKRDSGASYPAVRSSPPGRTHRYTPMGRPDCSGIAHLRTELRLRGARGRIRIDDPSDYESESLRPAGAA
jgi:hypothetical protein